MENLGNFNSKIFLGGDCNSNWREKKVIPYILNDYFNPIVEDWTPECIEIEEIEKIECKNLLFTFTKYSTGVYSVAEACAAIYSTRKRKNIFILNYTKDMEECKKRSYNASVELMKEYYLNNFTNYKAYFCDTFEELIINLNRTFIEDSLGDLQNNINNYLNQKAINYLIIINNNTVTNLLNDVKEKLKAYKEINFNKINDFVSDINFKSNIDIENRDISLEILFTIKDKYVYDTNDKIKKFIFKL